MCRSVTNSPDSRRSGMENIMDTRKTLLLRNIDDFPDSIKLVDLSEENRKIIENYVSFGEHLQDVHQLFKLLEFNLKQLFSYCIMKYDDRFIKTNGEIIDFYDINGLVINIISSAKTLIEALETFYEIELGEERKKLFKLEVLSKKYDDVFSYRFLLYMRNYAQHGHLPISHIYDKERFCFDLMQILSTQHIKPNKAIKESMEKVHNEIIERFGDEPKIAVTYTLDSFTVVVHEIYYVFLQTIENDVKEIFHKQLHLLDLYPELIYKGDNALNGYVFYQSDEGSMLHMYNPTENLLAAYSKYKEDAKNAYQKYKKEHVEIE